MSGVEQPVSQNEIPAGYDFFQTAPGMAVFIFQRFPIPAGFFSERSLPFTRVVRFRGRPLPHHHFNGLDISHIDTVVRRNTSLVLAPPYPRSGVVPIELVGLALETVEPLEVRVGKHIQLWDATAGLSPSRPSEGQMTITKDSPEGGTFDSELTVFPLIRFVRRCDGKEKVLDVGALPLPDELVSKLTLRSRKTPWLHEAPNVLRLAGLNDNFVAGVPGRVQEDGDAKVHEPDEIDECLVTIQGSACLCMGQSRVYRAEGSPSGPGSSYLWSISRGSDRATITSARNAETVTVRGTAVSRAANDINLSVEYTAPNGRMCVYTVALTTISVTLELRKDSDQTLEDDDGIIRQPGYGHPQLGPVSPGNPANCEGFFNNVEIKATVEPNDPALSCDFTFQVRRQGRSGLILPNGTFVDDQLDCPGQWCEEVPLGGRGVDTSLSSLGTIYLADSPGIDRGFAGVPACDTQGEVQLFCMNFRTWVEVDEQPCSQRLQWFSSTRIRCDQGRFVRDIVGNALDEGSINCIVPGPPGVNRFDASTAVHRLQSATAGERLMGSHAVIMASQSGELTEAAKEDLIPDLIRIASRHHTQYPLYSSEELAISLLGVLQAQDATEVLLQHLLTRFPRPIVGSRQFPATVATEALTHLGTIIVPWIIEKAAQVTDEEWASLAFVLGLLEDQAVVHRGLCAVLDSDVAEATEERLVRCLGPAVRGL